MLELSYAQYVGIYIFSFVFCFDFNQNKLGEAP